MKKAIALSVSLLIAGFAFSQKTAELDYVEVGVDESKPDTYKVLEFVAEDGSTKKFARKIRHFSKENTKDASSHGTAFSTDELTQLISEKKRENEYVKEMYEEDGVYYILFHKGEIERKNHEMKKR